MPHSGPRRDVCGSGPFSSLQWTHFAQSQHWSGGGGKTHQKWSRCHHTFEFDVFLTIAIFDKSLVKQGRLCRGFSSILIMSDLPPFPVFSLMRGLGRGSAKAVSILFKSALQRRCFFLRGNVKNMIFYSIFQMFFQIASSVCVLERENACAGC